MDFRGKVHVQPNGRVVMDGQLEAPEPVRMCPKAKAGPVEAVVRRGKTVAEYNAEHARKLQ